MTNETKDDLPPALPSEDAELAGEETAAPKVKSPKAPKAPPADNAHVAEGAEQFPIDMNEKVTIIIDEPNNSPSNQQFFGHNGTGYLITFGEPVKVPRFFLSLLNELITTRTIPTEGGGFTERDSLRFPYRIVG